MSAPSPISGDPSATPDYSNGALVRRLLKLTWGYKYRCIEVLGLQFLLLTLGLMGLNLTGVGIDYVRHFAEPGAPPVNWPAWLPQPAANSPVLHGLVLVAGSILTLAILRAFLNYGYSVAVARLMQHHLVVDLRAQVYDKLQRLSFRFFDENASGSRCV